MRGIARFLSGFSLLILLVCGCSQPKDESTDSSDPLEGPLVFSGSSTLSPLVTAIGKRFQVIHPRVRIEVSTGGSDRGVNDARKGVVDIGMASRPLVDSERDLFGFPIARDGVCVMVNGDNPIQALTNQQIADIYLGKIDNWEKVGGSVLPITVLNRKKGRSEADIFCSFFHVKYADIKARESVGDGQLCIAPVTSDRGAIIYLSMGVAEREAQRGKPLKLLPIEGVAASSSSVRSGNYPLSRPLLLITNRPPTGLAKAFIDFALSSESTNLIEQYDFVPYLD